MVRHALGEGRVGHAGTLDPPATGLLVVLTGRATRLAQFVSMLPKRYSGVVRFGTETSTDDATGAVVGESDDSWRGRLQPELDAALRNVQGRTRQMPPAVSAKKIGGERAYRQVRRGEKPALEPASVVIERLRCEWFDRQSGEVHVDVVCSSGTYVRAIARDVGRELGTKAHLASLRRTEIGSWKVDDSLPLTVDGPPLTVDGKHFRPMSEAVAHLPAVLLPAEEAKRFTQGRKIPSPLPDGPVAVFSAAELLGVAKQSLGLLHPDVVLIG
ncbi:MAG TPA: tRNA pseudouridine(55) synthase TruB [Gemmatimonadales bacterium]|jgi:tRNA pseudouridine(55) synthase